MQFIRAQRSLTMELTHSTVRCTSSSLKWTFQAKKEKEKNQTNDSETSASQATKPYGDACTSHSRIARGLRELFIYLLLFLETCHRRRRRARTRKLLILSKPHTHAVYTDAFMYKKPGRRVQMHFHSARAHASNSFIDHSKAADLTGLINGIE